MSIEDKEEVEEVHHILHKVEHRYSIAYGRK
jgi:hypothetical protein